MLAEKLNMNVDDAESWIVNLIRNAEMDAKIDSKKASLLTRSVYFNSVQDNFLHKNLFYLILLGLYPDPLYFRVSYSWERILYRLISR